MFTRASVELSMGQIVGKLQGSDSLSGDSMAKHGTWGSRPMGWEAVEATQHQQDNQSSCTIANLSISSFLLL
jgi:hypothetical protein